MTETTPITDEILDQIFHGQEPEPVEGTVEVEEEKPWQKIRNTGKRRVQEFLHAHETSPGSLVEMSDGTVYRVTEKGPWVKATVVD